MAPYNQRTEYYGFICEWDSASDVPASLQTKPGKAVISQAKSQVKKQLRVQWKKQSGVTGYQVQYTTNKQFLSSITKAVKSTSTALTVKKLTSKKTYYVRVRAYKKIGKKYYFGAWSKVKTVKIK